MRSYYKKKPNRQYNLRDVYRWLLQGWEVEEYEVCYQNGEELLALSLNQPITNRVKNAAANTNLDEN